MIIILLVRVRKLMLLCWVSIVIVKGLNGVWLFLVW